MLPKFTQNFKTQASSVVPVHSKFGTLHFYLCLTDRPTWLQSSEANTAPELPTAQGQLAFLSQHCSVFAQICVCPCTSNGKSFNTASGNSCLNLRAPMHLSFGFIPDCLPWIICFLHLKEDAAGTSRIRVQAGGDPGFTHSPAGIWEGHSPCQGGMKRTILLRSPGSGRGWREAGWQAQEVKEFLKWK